MKQKINITEQLQNFDLKFEKTKRKFIAALMRRLGIHENSLEETTAILREAASFRGIERCDCDCRKGKK